MMKKGIGGGKEMRNDDDTGFMMVKHERRILPPIPPLPLIMNDGITIPR